MSNQNRLASDLTNHFSLPRFSIPHRMPLIIKNLQTPVSAPKINPWMDSMRSSSPTNHHTPSVGAHRPPSALQMYDHILEASKGKQIVVFLDYDGTLSPIVEDPDRALMSDEMRGAVREVAKHFPTAIVSGRSVDKVYGFVKLAELYYAGSHGLDIKGPAKGNGYKGNHSVLYQPASNFLPMIEEVYKALVEKTRTTPGASVEDNKFCVSVHFRRVDEKRWPELAEKVRQVLTGYPKLKLTQGRKVLEIRPSISWDKGKAVEFLLESLGYANSDNVMPVYIGDDRTDEDAFQVLRRRKQGFGILVSKVAKETNASYTLRDPFEVKCFLQRLVERKQVPRRGNCFRTSLGIKKTWDLDVHSRNSTDDQIRREFPRQFFARRF